MAFPIELILFVFLAGTAIAVSLLRDLFAAAMLTGIFSLLSAGLFTLMDAVDVAFTEAAVGAGISTVLVLGALSLSADQERPSRWRPLPLVVVGLTGAALLYGTLDMPGYGDPAAVIHHHVVPRYIRGATEEFGIPNIVTVVLGSYRGYDTFGETLVIFTAAIGVLLGLGTRRGETVEAAPSTQTQVHYSVLAVVSTALVPFILLFALYVQFHGDFGPGGGFQAGVLFAAGLVIYGLVHGLHRLQRVAPPIVLERGLALGALIYGLTGVASMLLGGTFLDYAVFDAHDPAHGRHLGILFIEAGVGITVACAMTLVFYAFATRAAHADHDEADR
jgi:multicomponent Na+:H+ antiporter subunit B